LNGGCGRRGCCTSLLYAHRNLGVGKRLRLGLRVRPLGYETAQQRLRTSTLFAQRSGAWGVPFLWLDVVSAVARNLAGIRAGNTCARRLTEQPH
jgi:hypothetical protein